MLSLSCIIDVFRLCALTEAGDDVRPDPQQLLPRRLCRRLADRLSNDRHDGHPLLLRLVHFANEVERLDDRRVLARAVAVVDRRRRQRVRQPLIPVADALALAQRIEHSGRAVLELIKTESKIVARHGPKIEPCFYRLLYALRVAAGGFESAAAPVSACFSITSRIPGNIR